MRPTGGCLPSATGRVLAEEGIESRRSVSTVVLSDMVKKAVMDALAAIIRSMVSEVVNEAGNRVLNQRYASLEPNPDDRVSFGVGIPLGVEASIAIQDGKVSHSDNDGRIRELMKLELGF
ncbi:hypothetical protein NE237_020375 [Protea cynaroides]|uniref:Uncharacterized protein n=1 Tax=Protea cynaroides TaxID=273540 RepID=A0A9Q0H741_9MAGN|nr:hypothetical protein NE237_020375 [Protea cynaroides]